MSSTMMMERTGLGMPGMGMPGMSGSPVGTPTGVTPSGNYLMVPRCTLKFEKCQGGMKIICHCDDPMACSMMQNLCTMLQGGMISCSMTMNGMTVCCCNLTMGMCRCEMTDKGVSIICTSGDAKCCEMIQACCDCLSCMTNAGCACCVMMNNTPIACGCCETSTSSSKSASKR
ncbi:MAG TPA: hypothetical protein VH575_13975 [Gemmataceae bacterium]